MQAPKGLLGYVRTNLQDAIAGVVAVVVGVLTILDLLDVLQLAQGFLAHAAVFVACGLTVYLLVDRDIRRHTEARRDAVIAQIAKMQADMAEQIALIGAGAEAIEVPPSEIGPTVRAILKNTTTWHFRGGSGRWQRHVVLPALAAVTDHDIGYVMQVINPSDRDLCARYAAYRARQRVAEYRRDNEGAPETIRDDILSCLYAVAWHSETSRIKPEIYLLPLYSPVRYDIGSEALIASVARSTARGLYAKAGGWYYASVLDEIVQACSEVPRVIMPVDPAFYPLVRGQVDADHVRGALRAATVLHPTGRSEPLLTDWSGSTDFAHIATLVFQPMT
ncbi:MAG: hypothetical protein DLM59_11215 [Pseudonocardiales bacterium]|nr:MAG: hypothetical protein DLM59_11215 [Pseudonocardiales bacterium]